VLALLALVAFPVFAYGAGIPEYLVPENETGITHESVKPKSSEGHSSHSSETQAKAHSSAAEGTKSKEPSEKPEGESSHSSTNVGGKGNNGGPGPSGGESAKGGGKPGGGSPEGKIGNGKEVPGGGSEAKAQPVSHKTESASSGSSPVLPILIVVVVLAAISIGFVIYRQRKGGSGQDGRVSSPNAS
jgi:cobalamin biosynthesis Mg chelatase CobN